MAASERYYSLHVYLPAGWEEAEWEPKKIRKLVNKAFSLNRMPLIELDDMLTIRVALIIPADFPGSSWIHVPFLVKSITYMFALYKTIYRWNQIRDIKASILDADPKSPVPAMRVPGLILEVNRITK